MQRDMTFDFDRPDLAQAMEDLTLEQIDALPFGVIRVDRDGRVVLLSRTEAELSGFGKRPAIGKIFFSDIAPCMGVDEFQGRIQRARERGHLDLEFGWVGDFSDRDRQLRVRVQSASDGGIWVCINRND
jgi:photoactive yellow protein